MNRILANNLVKTYGKKTVVDGLSLDIGEEVYALLGPNGAGKTTTIKMLCGLTLPSSGSAEICGKDVAKDAVGVKSVIGVSPQETAVAKNLSALENLTMVSEICGLGKERALEVLKEFSLDTQGKLRAGKLSGGWQRRLSIAMAVVSKPKVLFLDEPTLGLDIEARFELWDVIRELKKTTTIVLTTHYLEEAENLADRIGVIKDGKIIAEGTPKELREKYGADGDGIDEIYIKIIRGAK